MTRTRKWLIVIAGFLLLIVVLVLLFDWNLARNYVARKVSAATGRTFAINGDLNVRLSLRPRITANDVVMGNAEWAREPNMAEIKRLEFRIDLLQLLGGRYDFPEIILSQPRLAFEVNKDGTPNWVFDTRDKDKPTQFPEIGALAIDRGSAIYRDPKINTDLTLEVNTVDGDSKSGEPMVEVTGKGKFKGMAATASARGGALLNLRSADQPYPIKARIALGTTKASIDGVLIDPLHLKGENLNFNLEGSDLALLYPILGVPLPPTPAYKLAGDLNHTGDVWNLRRLKGVVGKSDLAGEFSVDTGRTPQFIKADLVSSSLDMADMGGFVGGERGNRPADAPPPADKVLPTETFNLEKLRSADADVRFRGAKIVTEKIPLEKMEAHLLLNGGILKLEPLNFSVAGGNLVTQIQMDGRKQLIATRADIAVKGLHLDQLMPTAKMSAVSAGGLGGRARLDMNGNSVAQMLGSANGEAALIMDGGTISELLLRLSNLDIANSVARLIGGDKQTPINCMVGTFNAVKGNFEVQALVIDTPKVVVRGTGNADFTSEALNLRLISESKGFSLVSLRGPIDVTGTFKNPNMHPELGKVLGRGGLALALGAVTSGLGALIPLLDFGKEKPSNCEALVADAKAKSGTPAADLKERPQTRARK